MILITAKRLITLRRAANIAMEAAKISQNMVKKVPTMEVQTEYIVYFNIKLRILLANCQLNDIQSFV